MKPGKWREMSRIWTFAIIGGDMIWSPADGHQIKYKVIWEMFFAFFSLQLCTRRSTEQISFVTVTVFRDLVAKNIP